MANKEILQHLKTGNKKLKKSSKMVLPYTISIYRHTSAEKRLHSVGAKKGSGRKKIMWAEMVKNGLTTEQFITIFVLNRIQ